MKTFEENLDAWLEGRLEGKELEQFEASLPEVSVAELEQQANELKLGSLLKTQIGTREMTNQEFFSHQISEAIARDEADGAKHLAAPVRETWWSISRLLWAGATSLAIFLVCTLFILREQPNAGKSGYLTDIQNFRLDPVVSPNATISVFP
ncbi:MAG TPA: hypothetical protein VF683_08355, partial [Chthoniobacterales bacterium]